MNYRRVKETELRCSGVSCLRIVLVEELAQLTSRFRVLQKLNKTNLGLASRMATEEETQS